MSALGVFGSWAFKPLSDKRLDQSLLHDRCFLLPVGIALGLVAILEDSAGNLIVDVRDRDPPVAVFFFPLFATNVFVFSHRSILSEPIFGAHLPYVFIAKAF